MENLLGKKQAKKENVAFSLLEERIESGKIFDFEVSSNSMSPLLEPGDTVSVNKAKLQDLQKGDIIVYRANENLCVHRYIYKFKKDEYSGFIAKGDNTYCFDQLPISMEQLVGKVISIRKNKKTIDLERTSWRIINYLLASISAIQAYVPISLQFLRRTFLRNREFRPGIFIRKGLCFIFSIPLKITVYIIRMVPLFYKYSETTIR